MLAVIYLSNARAWLLDHLTPSLPVPTDDVVSRVFIELSALEQVVAIHYGMAADWTGFVSSHAKPQWRYTLKKSCPLVRRKRATASALSSCLRILPTVASFPWLSKMPVPGKGYLLAECFKFTSASRSTRKIVDDSRHIRTCLQINTRHRETAASVLSSLVSLVVTGCDSRQVSRHELLFSFLYFNVRSDWLGRCRQLAHCEKAYGDHILGND
ncbi:e3 ubiquitin-protein ligase HERC2 [Trichonephila clavipes]|nr:e3 ubiquitin-protein ligase HERC2 [Trichonephila clavipes]